MTAHTEAQPGKLTVLPDGRMPPTSAANYLGLRAKTLAIWRSRGMGPPFTKLAGRVFYFKAVVDHWVAERSGLVSSTQARTKDEMRKRQHDSKVSLNPEK
jgi:hypothetical protein